MLINALTTAVARRRRKRTFRPSGAHYIMRTNPPPASPIVPCLGRQKRRKTKATHSHAPANYVPNSLQVLCQKPSRGPLGFGRRLGASPPPNAGSAKGRPGPKLGTNQNSFSSFFSFFKVAYSLFCGFAIVCSLWSLSSLLPVTSPKGSPIDSPASFVCEPTTDQLRVAGQRATSSSRLNPVADSDDGRHRCLVLPLLLFYIFFFVSCWLVLRSKPASSHRPSSIGQLLATTPMTFP